MKTRVTHSQLTRGLAHVTAGFCFSHRFSFVGFRVSHRVDLLTDWHHFTSVRSLTLHLIGGTPSSRRLLDEFGELKRQYWVRHLWARGYFAVTTGNVTDEMVK
ncbi:MAG: transposase, partial [Cyanobacteria bacterium J06648_11]